MQEYETIKRARLLLATSQGSPSERTTDGYKKRAMRLVRKELGELDQSIDSIIARAKESKSASTWFGNRAALSYSFRQMISALLVQQDKAQRALKIP